MKTPMEKKRINEDIEKNSAKWQHTLWHTYQTHIRRCPISYYIYFGSFSVSMYSYQYIVRSRRGIEETQGL